MSRTRRQPYLDTFQAPALEHGGELRKGKRKTARPIATRRAMHLVFRASSSRMHHFAKQITTLLKAISARHDVRVYRFANNHGHLHMLIRGKRREGIRNFLREFSGRVARLLGGGKFWELPVYSRIVEWGDAFQVTANYVVQNALEASGRIAYQPRSRKKGIPGKRLA